jgi:hypothetical protein
VDPGGDRCGGDGRDIGVNHWALKSLLVPGSPASPDGVSFARL